MSPARRSEIRTECAPQTPKSGFLGLAGQKTTTDSTPATSVRVWMLWLPARLGPMRAYTKTVNGVKVKGKRRKHELPPSANERLHHQARARWVKGWRESSRDIAKHAEMPAIERARITVIVRRTRLGMADPDNDLGRAKPIIDGLRDAGVLRKDTHGHVEYAPVREQKATADGPGIMLVVERLEV